MIPATWKPIRLRIEIRHQASTLGTRKSRVEAQTSPTRPKFLVRDSKSRRSLEVCVFRCTGDHALPRAKQLLVVAQDAQELLFALPEVRIGDWSFCGCVGTRSYGRSLDMGPPAAQAGGGNSIRRIPTR